MSWRASVPRRMVRAVQRPTDLRATRLASGRLTLQSFAQADAPLVFAAIDRTLARFMVWDPPSSLPAFELTGADWLSRMEQGTDLPLVIRLAAGREFLGMATLQNVNTAEPRLGIWLKEGAHGKGFGREAGHAVLDWACRVREVEFLRYPVVAGDIPSKRLARGPRGREGRQPPPPQVHGRRAQDHGLPHRHLPADSAPARALRTSAEHKSNFPTTAMSYPPPCG